MGRLLWHIPKLLVPPFKAQNKSGFEVALASRTEPLATTIWVPQRKFVAERMGVVTS